jgi:hypothetical protein
MSDATKAKLNNLLKSYKSSAESDGKENLTSGIYYSNIDGNFVDLYKITYSPDNPELFDIECLSDQTGYSKELLISILSQYYYNPFKQKEIDYKNNKNVDILIDTIYEFYSTIAGGIRKNVEEMDTTDSTGDESLDIVFIKGK